MSDLKLFRTEGGNAAEIEGRAVTLEKSLQGLMERNLESMLGIRFLASEHSTGSVHGGRIDTLGLDENGCPVIIEYKRAVNENVINQGLFYLDWLMDHRADFKLLVLDRLGREVADDIDWSSPRLLCIAGDFTKYDEHAVKQMNRNIELLRYKRFGEELLLLELINATAAEGAKTTLGSGDSSGHNYKTIDQVIDEAPSDLRDLYEELRATLLALGDDVQEKTLRFYVAFKRLKNFACVELRPSKGHLLAFVKVNPDEVQLEDGFTRDVREIGHFGTGDLEITIRSSNDIQRAHDLFVRSYEAS